MKKTHLNLHTIREIFVKSFRVVAAMIAVVMGYCDSFAQDYECNIPEMEVDNLIYKAIKEQILPLRLYDKDIYCLVYFDRSKYSHERPDIRAEFVLSPNLGYSGLQGPRFMGYIVIDDMIVLFIQKEDKISEYLKPTDGEIISYRLNKKIEGEVSVCPTETQIVELEYVDGKYVQVKGFPLDW